MPLQPSDERLSHCVEIRPQANRLNWTNCGARIILLCSLYEARTAVAIWIWKSILATAGVVSGHVGRCSPPPDSGSCLSARKLAHICQTTGSASDYFVRYLVSVAITTMIYNRTTSSSSIQVSTLPSLYPDERGKASCIYVMRHHSSRNMKEHIFVIEHGQWQVVALIFDGVLQIESRFACN